MSLRFSFQPKIQHQRAVVKEWIDVKFTNNIFEKTKKAFTWSINNKLETSFQLSGSTSTSAPPPKDLQGPISRNNPVNEEHPGPPFNHSVNGEFLGLFRDSKNQKNRFVNWLTLM